MSIINVFVKDISVEFLSSEKKYICIVQGTATL